MSRRHTSFNKISAGPSVLDVLLLLMVAAADRSGPRSQAQLGQLLRLGMAAETDSNARRSAHYDNLSRHDQVARAHCKIR